MISFTELIKKLLNLYSSNFFLIILISVFQLIWRLALILIPVSLPTAIRSLPFVIGAAVLITLFTELAFVHAFSKISAGSSTSAKAAFASALRNFPWFLMLSILWFAVILVGTLFLIVPGIIFAVWFMFISAVLVIEKKRGLDAFSRSKSLVSGHVLALLLRAAGVAVLLIFIARAASEGFRFIIDFLSSGPVTPVLITLSQIFDTALYVLLAPFFTATIVLLYYEMRRIKGETV